MFCRTLIVTFVLLPAVLPTASHGYDIKARIPDSAFTGKQRPDILGISANSTADAARGIFESAFKGRADAKTDIQQQKFGGTSVSYISALNFTATGSGNSEVLSANFSSPASGNRAFFVARSLTFAPDQQPSKAEMVRQVMEKYGVPTLAGDQHLYYAYRGGSIMSVGAKYKEAAVLEAIDRPLDPRMALKLNAESGRGSCVAVVKRALARERTLSALLDDAKGANCDGVLSVQLTSGTPPDRVGAAHFTLLDVKRIISATAIDGEALAAELNERNPQPRGSAPKL